VEIIYIILFMLVGNINNYAKQSSQCRRGMKRKIICQWILENVIYYTRGCNGGHVVVSSDMTHAITITDDN
jgi:hypothetical protein